MKVFTDAEVARIIDLATRSDRLVAVTDIADRLGVKSNVVSNWTKRYADFPMPLFVIARGQVSVYDWAAISAWAWARGKGRRT